MQEIHAHISGRRSIHAALEKLEPCQVADIAEGSDRVFGPARRANKNLINVDAASFAVGNHDVRATEVSIQYELSCEAKEKERKKLNLTTNEWANVINVSDAMREKDLTACKKRGDNTEDCLGLVQMSRFHEGFEVVLYVKEILEVRLVLSYYFRMMNIALNHCCSCLMQLYSVLRKKCFVGYFDGTGGLVQIRGCALKKHLIHSRLSFNPSEILLSDTEFVYENNLFHAVTVMEHIGHAQSG